MKWKVQPGYKYTRRHEWAGREGNLVSVGITDYAQDMLKEIVYVELPAVGRLLKAGEAFAVIESANALTERYSPVAGAVVAVNEALIYQPELLNQAPYTDGWMIRIEVEAGYENPDLLTDAEYSAVLREESA